MMFFMINPVSNHAFLLLYPMSHFFTYKLRNELDKHLVSKTVSSIGELDLTLLERDGFLIDGDVGNNSFGYESGSTLWCPPVVYDERFNVELGAEIVFRDHELPEETRMSRGLASYVASRTLSTRTPIFVCDNHNHVLEAWRLLASRRPVVVHIDQHEDDASCAENITDWRRETRICDYLDYARRQRWIADVIRFVERRDLPNLRKLDNINECVLNLDLDFFASEMTLFSLKEKVEIIAQAASKAVFVTLATSPGFIDQSLAVEIAKLLHEKL